MRVIKSVRTLQALTRAMKTQNKTIGFVPTMGAFHEGHLSLMRSCRRENDCMVVSIFVNSKQFGPREDFSSYPRQEKKDKLLAKKEKVDIIFYPSEKEMYPTGFLTSIQVSRLTQGLCGARRPGHFQSVATIVCKLLQTVTPDIVYVGQKDAQQAAVIKRMVADLNIPTKVNVRPTVRERDGLAMSSRNIHLTERQRHEAPVLYEALKCAKNAIYSGERQAEKITQLIGAIIKNTRFAEIDYVACVDADSLMPLKQISGKVMIALAVKFGQTRLIDNIVIRIS